MQGGLVPDSREGVQGERGAGRQVFVGVFSRVLVWLFSCQTLLFLLAEHRDVYVTLRVQADVLQ